MQNLQQMFTLSICQGGFSDGSKTHCNALIYRIFQSKATRIHWRICLIIKSIRKWHLCLVLRHISKDDWLFPAILLHWINILSAFVKTDFPEDWIQSYFWLDISTIKEMDEKSSFSETDWQEMESWEVIWPFVLKNTNKKPLTDLYQIVSHCFENQHIYNKNLRHFMFFCSLNS